VLSQTDILRARATEYLWSLAGAARAPPDARAGADRRSLDDALEEAAQLMERAHVHRLVVVGEDQLKPIGIISTSDLVRALARTGRPMVDQLPARA
jgi:hypothetical protein